MYDAFPVDHSEYMTFQVIYEYPPEPLPEHDTGPTAQQYPAAGYIPGLISRDRRVRPKQRLMCVGTS